MLPNSTYFKLCRIRTLKVLKKNRIWTDLAKEVILQLKEDVVPITQLLDPQRYWLLYKSRIMLQ